MVYGIVQGYAAGAIRHLCSDSAATPPRPKWSNPTPVCLDPGPALAGPGPDGGRLGWPRPTPFHPRPSSAMIRNLPKWRRRFGGASPVLARPPCRPSRPGWPCLSAPPLRVDARPASAPLAPRLAPGYTGGGGGGSPPSPDSVHSPDERGGQARPVGCPARLSNYLRRGKLFSTFSTRGALARCAVRRGPPTLGARRFTTTTVSKDKGAIRRAAFCAGLYR